MAAFVYTDAYVSINATDLSSDVKSVELNVSLGTEDATTMGSDWETLVGGVLSGTVRINFVDDFDDSAVDDVLWAALIARASVAFEVRPDSAVAGANNPKFTGSLFVSEHTVGGDHGSLAMKSVTYPTTGTITRAEA